jgi:hypothetical protein
MPLLSRAATVQNSAPLHFSIKVTEWILASLCPWMTKFASFGHSRTFATICFAATLIGHGMDYRVCARRFAPCSALE